MQKHMFCAAGIASLLVIFRPGEASAEATVDTTSQGTGPSMAMVDSGVGTFALSYIPAVAVGATSGLQVDRTLFVPVAGPWIDLTQRPACGPVTSCNAESTAKVLLVTDGIFQAIGTVTILGGFLTPSYETRTVRYANATPALRLAVGRVDGRAYGVLALGTF